MQSPGNKVYNASDFERYHSGSMPADEMHALERAAMEDPFLADALEGYRYTSAPAADLQKIRSRLNEKNNNKAGIIPFYKRSQWLKIAAAVLILAGGGWIAISVTNRGEKDLALQKAPARQVSPPQDDKTSPFRSDSIENAIVKIDDQKIQDDFIQQKTPETSVSSSQDGSSEKDQAIIAPEVKQGEYSRRNTEMARQAEESRSRMANHSRFESMERERMNRPSPDPNASGRNQSQFENFMKQRTVNQSDRNVASSDPNKATQQNDTIDNLNIVMKPTDAPPAEVVILSRGNAVPARRPVVIIDTLEPAEGWTNFDDYIASNLKAPDEMKTKSMSGEVQLSFDVNNHGQPVNIAVVKSLCQECDAEAIRLLKEGPKWKKKKNARGRITIRF